MPSLVSVFSISPNGDTVSYTYDPFDRTTAETYNDGTTNHYIYASDGSLARQYATNRNNAATEQYSYQYDSLGRLIHSREQNGADTFASTGQGFLGCNMFAYCGNNPVNFADPTGSIALLGDIALCAFGFVIIGLAAAVTVISN